MQVNLGKIGVWTAYRAIGEENAGEAARLVEELGYGVFWLGGSPRLASVRRLLEATENLVVATGIVNVWAYDPAQLAGEYAALVGDFPERLLVGIGIGHPEATSEYSRPLSAMRAFLDGLDRADAPLPADRRCLAALAPKMLALSAERSLGADSLFRAQWPYELRPSTAGRRSAPRSGGRIRARRRLRPRPPQGSWVRAAVSGLCNYTNNLLRHGFSDEDIANGGSDRLIDAVIPHGSADEIATAVRAHLDAGADHVALQAIGEPGIPREGWTALAEAMAL